MDSKYICTNKDKDKDKSQKVKICLIATLNDTINTLEKLYKYCNDFRNEGEKYEYILSLKDKLIKLDSIIKNLNFITEKYESDTIQELYNKANPNILDNFTLLYLNTEITTFISKNKLTINNELIELNIINVIAKNIKWGKLTQEDPKSTISEKSQYDIKYKNIVSDYPIVINIMSVLYKHLIHILLYELKFYILIQNKKDEYIKFNKIKVDKKLSIFEKKFKEVLLFFINEINSLNTVYDYNNENFNNLLRACIRIFTTNIYNDLKSKVIEEYELKNNNYIIKYKNKNNFVLTKLNEKQNIPEIFKTLYKLLELKYNKTKITEDYNVFSFFDRTEEKMNAIPDELYISLENNRFIKKLKQFEEINKSISAEKLTGKDLLKFLLS